MNAHAKKFAPSLSVEQLECRLAPATWPVAGGPSAAPVVGVYGQFQDLPRNGWDESVRLSEGLAIAAPAGTTVRPGVAGTIVESHRASNPYDSFVVVRENVPAGQAPRYWAYHHVQPPALTSTLFGLTKLLGSPTTVGPSESLGQIVATPAALRPEVVDHVRVELGTALAPLNGLDYIAPTLNPLSHFGNDLDAAAPTIDGLTIRREADEGLGETKVVAGSILSERPRTTSHYYGPAIGGEAIWVGRRATVVNGTGNTAADATGIVDLVVQASDGFGAGTRQLGVHRLDFAIAGQSFGAGSGSVPAVDFAAANPADFATAAARRVYENDWRNDSGSDFHYTVTNVTAAPGVFDARGWNTAGAGTGFAWNDKAAFATTNAEAAFPDDVYDVAVTAADEAGNLATRAFPVLVDNWQQSVAPGQTTYAAGEPIDLTGDGYRAGQTVAVYLVPASGVAAPANGLGLSPEHLAGTVTADADGRLDGTTIPGGAAGSYWVVADYNGDGAYTSQLDGAAALGVIEQQVTITAADDVLLAAFDPDTGHYFVPAPGVLANDTASAGVLLGATGYYIPASPNDATADVNPDGSITVVLPIEPAYTLPLVFEYQAYYDPPAGGPRVWSNIATVTLYLDDGSGF